MAKREDDLADYAGKKVIIAYAPAYRQSDSDYWAYLESGNTKTHISVLNYIKVAVFKPVGDNARVIGYNDGSNIKILGNSTLYNYNAEVSYQLASISSDQIGEYTVERYPDDPETRKENVVYSWMDHNYYDASGSHAVFDIGLDWDKINFPDPDGYYEVSTKSYPVIFQNPNLKFGKDNGGFQFQEMTINPDNAEIVVPITNSGKWTTAQASLSHWNDSVIDKSNYDLIYTDSDNLKDINKKIYDYYHDDALRYFKIDQTNREAHAYLGTYSTATWGDHQWSADQVDAMPVRVYNLLVTKNLEQAQKYVADGTLPDDVYVSNKYPGDDDIQPTDSPDDAGEDGNLKDDVDRIVPTKPDATTVTLSDTHYYSMTTQKLQDFFNGLWNLDIGDIVFNQVTGIYSNLVENVISLRWFPVTPDALGNVTGSEGIKLGYTTLDVACPTINSVPSPIVGGLFDIQPAYKSYMDYAPYTDIQVYLPLYGMLDLDTNLFMGHKLQIEYTVDIASGLITYLISRNETIINQVQAKCGIDIPITLSSMIDVATQISTNVVSKSVSLASATASGSPIGMIGSVLGNTASPKMRYLSGVGDNGALYGNRQVTLFIKHPQYNRPANYGKMVGYPTYGKFSLSKLTGFAVIENPKIGMTKKMELSEYNEIISLMQGGIYL